MEEPRSDALVLFGATGDLAGKMILPAVCALAARGAFEVPLVAVGRHDIGALRSTIHSQLDECAESRRPLIRHLTGRIRYVAGDVQEADTYAKLKRALQDAQHPLYYLAIPPDLFSVVVEQLARAGAIAGARIAVEKPFGHDLASAHALNAVLRKAFPERAIFRVDHFLAKDPVRDLVFLRFGNRWPEPIWNRDHIASLQITMAETFGVSGRGRFYDAVGALRDVFQNHLLQIVALLTMEPPERPSARAIHTARVAALSAIRPLAASDIVRGQYQGYRDEDGVARDSRSETYVALRLRSQSPRWKGVPICVRTGKHLSTTTTEVWVAFKPPAIRLVASSHNVANHIRFRLGPGRVDVGLGAYVKRRGAAMIGEAIELGADLGVDEDRDAYERLLDAALAGDHALDESAEGAFASWRIVERVINADLPVFDYMRGSWGPREADLILPRGIRWHDPQIIE
ncbi:MAG TPA: glucose-6-phosphate dehydrogenase [Casimicrobiaceae bacterium]|jgi:glucose-6-phosphate 1-dehydrogenase